jgi:diguanylate cyclase (GGDEF)-like protein
MSQGIIMLPNYLQVLESLNLIYEDLDIDKVEEKFIDLVTNAFSFDRCALLFVKHKKKELQGKLARGFTPEEIASISIPLIDEYLFIKPLITGSPLWGEDPAEIGAPADLWAERLGLKNFVLVPVASKTRKPCWEIKRCEQKSCPAYGKKWLRCWMVSDALYHHRGCILTRPEEKAALCEQCAIYLDRNIETMEGILLVDNSISNTPIGGDRVAVLTIIANAVGRAVNNSKLYVKTLNEAIRDGLTRLYNRRYFNERLHDEVHRGLRYGEAVSLIICDIDHFKRVNDNFGHPVGDEVLVWVADMLRRNRRKSDVITRFGGEEFALLLLNTNRVQAGRIAEELRRSFDEKRFPYDGGKLPITMSFGVAELGDTIDSAEELVEQADRALYRAKNTGRNRICLAEEAPPPSPPAGI